MKLFAPSLLAALLLSAATAAAQATFRLGLRAGANRAATTLDAASTYGDAFHQGTASKSAVYAWQVGVVADLSFGKVAVQPALLLSQKGEVFSTSSLTSGSTGSYGSETTSTNRYNWLELPLNVVYTLHGDHGLQVFAGPYVALAVGGRQQGTTLAYGDLIFTAPIQFDDRIAYGPATHNRRLDAGLNFGIGYRQGPLQAQLGYGLGLANLHQAPDLAYAHDFDAGVAHNRVAQLTATYFFAR